MKIIENENLINTTIQGVSVTISFASNAECSIPPLVFEILKAAYIRQHLS